MSRIFRPPYKPGAVADSTVVDADFDAFSQAGDIDAANLRDAAIDLPHLTTQVILINAATANIGTGASGWTHDSPVVVASSAITPAPKNPVVDGAGVGTPLALGAGWAMDAGQVLRVYWDLSVNPTYSGSPWAGQDGEYAIPNLPGPGNHVINCGAHCWLVSLQWDVTSAALANWAEVSGQTSYSVGLSGRTGGALADSPAAVPVPAWRYTTTDITEGEWRTASATEDPQATGWTSASGAWYYTPPAPITIYGLRLVIHGIYHPAQTATENYLVVDTGVSGAGQTLEYDGGTLTALHQRTGA